MTAIRFETAGDAGRRRSARWGYILLVAGVLVFSSVEVAARYLQAAVAQGAERFPPLRLACLRFIIAGALLMIPTLVQWRRKGVHITGRDAFWLSMQGLVGISIGIGLFHASLLFLPANVCAIVFSANPVFVAGFAPLLLHEKIDPRVKGGLLAGVAGIGVFLAGEGTATGGRMLGLALLAASMAAFALYTVLSKRFARAYGTLPVTAVTSLAGGLLLLPATWIREGYPFAGVNAANLLPFLYMVLVATAAGYALYFAGIDRAPDTTRGSQVFFLKPVCASLLAWWILGETLSGSDLLGGACILASMFIAFGPRRRQTPPP